MSTPMSRPSRHPGPDYIFGPPRQAPVAPRPQVLPPAPAPSAQVRPSGAAAPLATPVPVSDHPQALRPSRSRPLLASLAVGASAVVLGLFVAALPASATNGSDTGGPGGAPGPGRGSVPGRTSPGQLPGQPPGQLPGQPPGQFPGPFPGQGTGPGAGGPGGLPSSDTVNS